MASVEAAVRVVVVAGTQNTVRERLDAEAIAGSAVATLGDGPRNVLERPVGRSVRGAVPEDVGLVADGYWDLSRIFWDRGKADLLPDGTARLSTGSETANHGCLL